MISENMKSRKTGVIAGAIAAVAVVAIALAGAGNAALPGFIQKKAPTRAAPAVRQPTGSPMSFADIFEKVSPAVVSIEVTERIDLSRLNIPGLQLPPGGRGRGAQPPGRGGPPPGEDDDEDGPLAQSSGSGFFISADGYIVTNDHVIKDAREIKVILKDEREFIAKVVGRDENTDLAVIKVEGRNFPFVSFENSARPRVGDWVLSIGNPFGLGGTATAGIVSASGRNLGPEDSSYTFVDYLQIDAPINPGNSGGPTFDLYGRVIGVNAQILSPGQRGGSVGIGFAIPAELADKVTRDLITNGSVQRGYLGAGIRPFTKEYAEAQGLDMPDAAGALVMSIAPGGPAEKAGLQIGDVIVSLNGQKVKDSTDLTRSIAGTRTGDTLRLEILREGRPRTITATSGKRPTMQEIAAMNGPGGGAATDGAEEEEAAPTRPTVLGMGLSALDPATRRRLQVPATQTGVVIESVTPGSSAAKLGLQAGDLIVQARGVSVNTPADVLAAVEAQKRGNRTTILLLVMRAGQNVSVIVELAEPAPRAGRPGRSGAAPAAPPRSGGRGAAPTAPGEEGQTK